MRRLQIVLVAVLAVATPAACSDKTKNSAKEAARSAREDVANAAGSAGALALAQSFRAALEAKDLPAGKTERDVSVLNQIVRDLPGNPKFTGIVDKNGDGKDDDGKVVAHVGDQVACITISVKGAVNVHGGSCT